jgi:hypothetical protein
MRAPAGNTAKCADPGAPQRVAASARPVLTSSWVTPASATVSVFGRRNLKKQTVVADAQNAGDPIFQRGRGAVMRIRSPLWSWTPWAAAAPNGMSINEATASMVERM